MICHLVTPLKGRAGCRIVTRPLFLRVRGGVWARDYLQLCSTCYCFQYWWWIPTSFKFYEVTHSYSSCPFLCTLATQMSAPSPSGAFEQVNIAFAIFIHSWWHQKFEQETKFCSFGRISSTFSFCCMTSVYLHATLLHACLHPGLPFYPEALRESQPESHDSFWRGWLLKDDAHMQNLHEHLLISSRGGRTWPHVVGTITL